MKHHIKVNKTAIYHSLGNIKTAKSIWFVLHGYGMRAKYFVNKFNPIVDDTNCVIAPEGLSKFYTEGFYGRVGATWMTKEDREEEIKDYINYLNQLYDTIINENDNANLKINVVGFSQGGATASRWVANGQLKINNFILWSSVFPNEMEFETFGQLFNTFILYGNKDEFSIHIHVKKQAKLLEKSKLQFKLIEFEGIHDVPKDILIQEKEANNW